MGWEPRVGLDEGIARTVIYFEELLGGLRPRIAPKSVLPLRRTVA